MFYVLTAVLLKIQFFSIMLRHVDW